MKLRKIVAGSLLAIFMHTAAADPVVLDITFDAFPEETGFGIWDAATAPTDLDILFDPLMFNGPPLSSNPGIAFDALASSPIAPLSGFAPAFSFFFIALPGVPYHFDWDLAAGDYTLIVLDLFADGIAAPGGYSISVNGTVAGTGSGLPFQFERTNFTVAAVAVAEPATLTLLALGLMGIGAQRRRRQQ